MKTITHLDGCSGEEGCPCEDQEDCDDDCYCDDDEDECVAREDSADALRVHMFHRYDVDLRHVPSPEVVRRAAALLGVDARGKTEAGAAAVVTARADVLWRRDSDRGKFAGDAGVTGTARRAADQLVLAGLATRARDPQRAVAHANLARRLASV